MEPLKPIVRDALKKEHPGLDDGTIDRVEELLAQRFQIDPDAEPQRLQEIDRERLDLIRQNMPKFDQVIQKVRGEERAKRGLD